MKLTRIWSDESGASHFEDLEVPLRDAGLIGRLSELRPASGIVFRENDPGYDYDWHPAPRRQYVILLDGEIEIEVGDGETRRFRGGEVLLLEDTSGRGHRTRHIRPEPRRSIFIPIDPA